ncbi:cytosolic Fe-S cluster assembly factor NUBP2 isoform X4 [Oryx dammah]|uniref:cytosolic Fe-S cluster assembly factor NUBP2 isoform X4 n=1 Tax=Oryx dammah TaxID=59534 RepID=UPI001A9BE965|nr:cytosolic Fe-S cluster assembly factor NUBP2 isoform X4 [Oryx dammah]
MIRAHLLQEPGNLAGVRHIVLVLSGKGGVGKSTISTELALALRHAGKKVGILDVDLCGPSVPRMLRAQGRAVHQGDSGWVPVFVDREQSISLMSVGFLLEQPDEAVVWRGPKKNGGVRGGREAGADLLQEGGAAGDRARGEHERLCLPPLLGVHQHLLQGRRRGAGKTCRCPLPGLGAPGPRAHAEPGGRPGLHPGLPRQPRLPRALLHRPEDSQPDSRGALLTEAG